MSSSLTELWDRERELDAKANDLYKLQKVLLKYYEVRKKTKVQLGESELALKELLLLKEDAIVYKLIGPLLLKQDHAKANANLRKRIKNSSAELKRLDETIEDLEEKQTGKKIRIMKLEWRLNSLLLGNA